ncbi:putative phage-associated protein [Phaeobacter inhibens]|uniref:Panacea domain-containing protein n=1 Tax=Phaeobacter inhibens TaxID=221822 RepID=UPI000C9BAC7B|nr:type II toxin-antitoxin system antitoxin SocA domain-containing protein [Phaeobacter inhibens]AUR12464.1 putative phage-associated protein [Phaeobacter inhibens]
MSAQVVADDILKIAKRRGMPLTPMQLMKLVYISYGWYLAMHNDKLFNDRIEAWKYGPVIPNLYQATKRFGRGEIPTDLVADGPISNPSMEAFYDSIVENYGKYSGIALSNLTHRQGTPWQRVFQTNVMSTEIPDEYIRDHYQQGLDARRATPTPA